MIKTIINRIRKEFNVGNNNDDLKLVPDFKDRLNWLKKIGFNSIIDVGAHRGEFLNEMKPFFPEAEFFLFEPIEECFNAITISDSRTRKFKLAVSDYVGETSFYVSSKTQCSSLLKMGEIHKNAYPTSSGEIETIVEVSTLDETFANIPLEEKILLKIDTQGSEINVLKGATKLLSRTTGIIVESSFQELYIGQSLFKDVYQLLNEYSFEMKGYLGGLHHPVDGLPLQLDGYFQKIESN
tara:strand:+ start:29 stop:745 length:717 start_codon:yes stop_codon:yes gene_type:complete